jgi:hypothetical protein
MLAPGGIAVSADIPTDPPERRKIEPSPRRLLQCGEGARTHATPLEETQTNQCTNWLRRNLDLVGCGQYGPRGF